MRRQRILLSGLSTLALLGGCKRRTEQSPPPPTPTTRVAVLPSPATAPAEAVPAAFRIANQVFSFPSAKLVTKQSDGGLRVTLFSVDPPEAVKDGYQGNSFYFRFNMDADTLDDLDGQQFLFRNSFAEQDETTSGLYIAGGRQTLRPTDASISFERVEKQWLVHVLGNFRLYDEQAGGDAPIIVSIQATLEPTVVDATKK